jgi:hypothetical protein
MLTLHLVKTVTLHSHYSEHLHCVSFIINIYVFRPYAHPQERLNYIQIQVITVITHIGSSSRKYQNVTRRLILGRTVRAVPLNNTQAILTLKPFIPRVSFTVQNKRLCYQHFIDEPVDISFTLSSFARFVAYIPRRVNNFTFLNSVNFRASTNLSFIVIPHLSMFRKG